MGKLNIIGLGYIGLPTALMFAANGVEVVGTDLNDKLVGTLNEGKLTFEEDGLEEVFKLAKEKEITRSMAGVELAAKENVDIFVFGNAPTALFKLRELIKEGKANPKLIVAVPVGFVGASESKEDLDELGIPYIRVKGRKGGSTVAAAIINALLYMNYKRDM